MSDLPYRDSDDGPPERRPRWNGDSDEAIDGARIEAGERDAEEPPAPETLSPAEVLALKEHIPAGVDELYPKMSQTERRAYAVGLVAVIQALAAPPPPPTGEAIRPGEPEPDIERDRR